MDDLKNLVAKHYDKRKLYETIISILEKNGKDINQLTIEDLAPVDQFHIRGLKASKELAEFVEINSKTKVLDIGCGIGGLARFLSSRYNCFVTGLDLIEEYCITAAALSKLLKLEGKNDFEAGNAVNLPFENELFDVVWTEHVQMNISDKEKFYSEICRVLKKNGKLIFHDVFNGKNKNMPVIYPVPWADDESISFLMNPDELNELLINIGFKIELWEDKTKISGDAFKKTIAGLNEKGLPPLSMQLLMGGNTKDKLVNMTRNLLDKRVTVVQCVCTKQ